LLLAAPPFRADEGALKELKDTFGYGEGFLTVCLAYCNNDAQQVTLILHLNWQALLAQKAQDAYIQIYALQLLQHVVSEQDQRM